MTVENNIQKELITFKESMWPIDPNFLKIFPEELLPSFDQISKLDYPWELLDLLMKTLAERLKGKENIFGADLQIRHPELVTFDGPVWIGDGVKIPGAASIVGPIFIGDGALIGNYSVVRGSLIGPQTETGIGSEVVRSVIGPGTKIHRAYAGDSILSPNVSLGGQAQTANFRHDGQPISSYVKDVRINTRLTKLGAMIGEDTFVGASTQIMPGVKIGHDCFIGPQALLQKDVPDNTIVKLQQALEIKQKK